MKKQIILLSLIIPLTFLPQTKIYEEINPIEVDEIDDAFSFSHQNTAVTFSYQGNDLFKIMQIKTGYSRDDAPQQPETLLDKEVTLSEEFKEIELQGFSVLAKIKKSSDKTELIVTRDVINYVDLSVDDIIYSESKDK